MNNLNIKAYYKNTRPLTVEEAVRLSRIYGGSPSNADIEILLERVNGKVYFDQFLEWHNKYSLNQADDTNFMLSCFMKFGLFDGKSNKNGYIDWIILKNLLTTIGETLNETEFSSLAYEFSEDGSVNFSKLLN